MALQRGGGARSATGDREEPRTGHTPSGDPHPLPGGARERLPDRGRAADADRLRPQLREGAGRARTGACDAGAPHRGPGAAGDHPPAHRPLRPGLDPRAPLGRGGGGAERPRRLPAELPRDDGARRRVRRADDAAPRHPRRRRQRAARGVSQLPRVGLDRRGHPPAEGWRGVEAARPHPARAAPPRPQPLGHALLGRGALDRARRRPPHQAHLLKPPAGPPSRRTARLHRPPPAVAGHLHRLAAADARDGRAS